MTLNGYQDRAGETDMNHPLDYYIHGLTNEAGEVSGVRKKALRGDYNEAEEKRLIRKELGDVQWYVARVAKHYGLSLEEIGVGNIQKLQDRAIRGVIKGSGDER